MMKKIVACIALISVVNLFGIINEWDPRLSAEERDLRKALNKKTREGYIEHNEAAENALDKEIAQATYNFIERTMRMQNIHDRDTELAKFIEETRDIKRKHQNIITG